MLLSKIPYPKGKRSFKVSKKLDTYCRANWNKERCHSTSNFIHVKESSKGVFSHEEWYVRGCHAANNKAKNVSAVVTEMAAWERQGCSLESVVGFATWFVKESYFSRFISNRSEPIEDILNSYLILSGELPTEILHTICIISRHFKECREDAFKSFDAFVGMGLSKEAAYMLCFNGNISICIKLHDEDSTYIDHHSGHRAFHVGGVKTIESFSKKGPHLIRSKGSFKTSATIYGASATHPSKDTLQSSLKEFPDLLKSLQDYRKPLKEEGYVPPNPFTQVKSKRKPDFFSHKEVWEVLVPFLISKGL